MRKIVRKVKEEPLVPLGTSRARTHPYPLTHFLRLISSLQQLTGIGLTVFAFVNAYRALRKGDSKQANRMFRARVLAQGFTVVAMVAGSMYYSKDREKTAELRKLKEQRDAEEKRQKWIRELEVRDDEEKAMKSRLQEKAARASAEASERRAELEADAAAAGSAEGTIGTGGILGKMGLWSQAETKAAEEQQRQKEEEEAWLADAATSEKKSKNPKSSLGAIGEIMSSQKKDGKDEPKK